MFPIPFSGVKVKCFYLWNTIFLLSFLQSCKHAHDVILVKMRQNHRIDLLTILVNAFEHFTKIRSI